MSWAELFSRKENAIGEVTGVDAGRIEIFVYPECYPRIRVGSIIAINSEEIKPVGLVIRMAHRPRHGQIQPLRKTRSEILKSYPDIDKYHRFVSTIAYTSHVRGDKLFHVRASMPRLHDLAFLVEIEDLLDAFFRPYGRWNFEFLRYFLMEGGGALELRELFFTHRNYFLSKSDDLKDIVEALAVALYKAGVRGNLARYIEDVLEILGEGQ